MMQFIIKCHVKPNKLDSNFPYFSSCIDVYETQTTNSQNFVNRDLSISVT